MKTILKTIGLSLAGGTFLWFTIAYSLSEWTFVFISDFGRQLFAFLFFTWEFIIIGSAILASDNEIEFRE